MRILLVGDDANLSSELLEYIADLGDEWHVQGVADGNAAIATVASSTVDAVIVAPALTVTKDNVAEGWQQSLHRDAPQSVLDAAK